MFYLQTKSLFDVAAVLKGHWYEIVLILALSISLTCKSNLGLRFKLTLWYIYIVQ